MSDLPAEEYKRRLDNIIGYVSGYIDQSQADADIHSMASNGRWAKPIKGFFSEEPVMESEH